MSNINLIDLHHNISVLFPDLKCPECNINLIKDLSTIRCPISDCKLDFVIYIKLSQEV